MSATTVTANTTRHALSPTNSLSKLNLRRSRRMLRNIISPDRSTVLCSDLPLENALGDQGHDRQYGQKRSDRKRGGQLVFVVEDFHVKWNRVRLPANVP